MVAALTAAAALTCRPEPGLGTVSLTRGANVEVVDLATCGRRVAPAPKAGPAAGLVSPDGRSVAAIRVVRAPHAQSGSQTIVVRDRATGGAREVYRVPESYVRAPAGEPGPLGLVGWSPDGRWLLFYLDPMGSASIAADGLELEVVSVERGKPHPIAGMLMYPDYLGWCGAPDGRSLVVQSQAASDDANLFHTHWSLWRVGLDGTRARLSTPPTGYADESPRFSRDGTTILFVRSHNGVGSLYALRSGALLGPLLSLGYQLGYDGHQDWWQTAAWSLASP